MDSPRASRHKPWLAVDRLEDRQVLSQAGLVSGWDAAFFGSVMPSPRAEFAPESGPPGLETSDRATAYPSTFPADHPLNSMSEAAPPRFGTGFGFGSWSTETPTAALPAPDAVLAPTSAAWTSSPAPAAHPAVDVVLAPVAVPASTGDRGFTWPGLVARSIPPTPTARVEAVGSADLESSTSSTAPTPAPSAVIPALPVEVAAATQARGGILPGTPASSGSTDAPSRPSAEPVAPRGGPEVRSSTDAPSRAVPGASPDEAPRPGGVEGEAREPNLDGAGDAPSPDLAGLITGLVPFARSSLEEAIGRFLEPFDELRPPALGTSSPIGLVSASLGVALTVATVEIAIRLRRSKDEQDSRPGGRPALALVPVVPRPWRATR